MFSLGNFESFDPARTKWSRYSEKLKHFLIANDVKEVRKLSTVLTLIGDLAFNILCDLIAPETPDSKTVEEVLEVLNRHFSPRTIARTERYKFRCRMRGSGESIADFIASLRKMSIDCGFQDHLDAHLADQFIFGLNNVNLQKRLLAEEDDVSFEKLIHLASLAEITDKGSSVLNQSNIVNECYSDVFNCVKTRDNSSHQASSFGRGNPCKHCGGKNHLAKDCRYKEAICNSCNVKGHISPICKFKQERIPNQKKHGRFRGKSRKINVVERDLDEPEVTFDIRPLSLLKVNTSEAQPILLEVKVNDVPCTFELDTGAAVSIMSAKYFSKSFPNCKLLKTNVKLRTISECINPVGKALVNVKFQNMYAENLTLYIVNEGDNSLLGRDWFKALNIFQKLSFKPILSFEKEVVTKHLDKLLGSFKDLFTSKLGELSNFKANLLVMDGAVPKFCKARPVPYALLAPIEAELLKLQSQGILTPIQFSEWAAPIVPIVKKDKSLRICGDYKVGLNPVLLVNKYPLPKIDDILAKLAGGHFFTTLDMTQAYQQVVMGEDSAKYLTINTHKGLFAVNRLPFGISSAPAIFQQFMDQILCDLPGVVCYLDDILVSAATLESHLQRLELVFQKLLAAGVRLNQKKCVFLQEKVEYLGHVIDGSGIQASPAKVKDILLAPDPKDVDQLRSFLGLISYYRKFLPNLSSILAPLNSLLRKGIKWSWNSEAKKSFSQVKEAIVSTKVLTHFDPDLQITLACDASPRGIGAVISHVFKDGTERPIAFASRTLMPAEKNYSQLDKEALSIIFGIKKFHQFLYGRKFTLWTDHKPLTRIFAADNQVPVLAAARLQRWSLLLAAYCYDIKFRPSKENSNADALSRLPCPTYEVSSSEQPRDIFLLNQIDSFPISHKDIVKETMSDSLMTQVLHCLKTGWPSGGVSKELSSFKAKSDELSYQNGCILWGIRVVIPQKLRSSLLQELHAHHTGIVRMKMLARSFFWWPGLDADVEKLAHACNECASQANNPAKAPLHPWSRPEHPWQRVHIDYAGPFMGYYFLVIVDAFSKWPEVNIMRSTTTMDTIMALNEHFSRYGFPNQLVSDNGSQFVSHIFETYCYNRGICHTKSAPYHPASNGQAERFVQILKRNLKRISNKDCMSQKVCELLFAYRTTPHSFTKKTPAELFLARELRTRLHLIRAPNQSRHMELPVLKSKLRSFLPGQAILTKNFSHNVKKKWIHATIEKRIGPVSYILNFPDGSVGKRHIDQIRSSCLPQEGVIRDLISDSIDDNYQDLNSYPSRVAPIPIPTQTVAETDSGSSSSHSEAVVSIPSRRRNPARQKKTPLRLQN